MSQRNDRIEIIFSAIDQMYKSHGKERPEKFGGGKWSFDEEVQIWKNQVQKKEVEYGEVPLSPTQWRIIDEYIKLKKEKLEQK